MQRAEFLNSVYLVAATVPLLGTSNGLPVPVAGVAVPDSAVAREAIAIARAAVPVEIYNHSLRTFYFAELVARAQNLAHDVEAVFVAALLHDAGLSQAYMSDKNRFEVDGANVARSLLSKHGIFGMRADLVWDAVSLHDSGGIARWKQTEVMLVNAGVGVDFGAALETLDRSDVVAVLEAAPRNNFIPVFLQAVAEVAKRKPFATGACFVTDVAYRMVPGFHLDNFCDEVKDNPFASFGPAGQT